MESLFGRLARLFSDRVPYEDLFTEVIARLFERRPQLCLDWLQEGGLLPERPEAGEPKVRVSPQKTFVALEHHDTSSRADLFIEIYWPPAEENTEAIKDVVVVESKIGSLEGEGQLRRYAEQLNGLTVSGSRMLLYITRAYEPKEAKEIVSGLDDEIGFQQLRWHDFYRFLHTKEKDALLEEVMAFMEEYGMSSIYRFSTVDIMALSGVPRAFEIFDETLGDEVRAELEAFAGNRIMREVHSINHIRWHKRYITIAQLHGWDLFGFVGYRMCTGSDYRADLHIADGYPAVFVVLEACPGAEQREVSVAAMREVSRNREWETYDTDDPARWAGVRRVKSLASILSEEDHVAAVKRFFVESIRQLRDELTDFKKEHPDLPWSGGETSPESP